MGALVSGCCSLVWSERGDEDVLIFITLSAVSSTLEQSREPCTMPRDSRKQRPVTIWERKNCILYRTHRTHLSDDRHELVDSGVVRAGYNLDQRDGLALQDEVAIALEIERLVQDEEVIVVDFVELLCPRRWWPVLAIASHHHRLVGVLTDSGRDKAIDHDIVDFTVQLPRIPRYHARSKVCSCLCARW